MDTSLSNRKAALAANHPDASPLILVADDDEHSRRAIELLLEPEGYRLAFAADGPSVLTLAPALRPSLILLDVMMPGIHGFAVCRALRATPVLGEVPIILITGLHDRAARLRGLEAGADEFLTKPFDGAELVVRIRTIIRLNRYQQLLAERAKFERAEEALRESEARCRQAQKMEAVGRVTSGIAHDFNNLLLVILGNSELLLANLEPHHPLRHEAEQIRDTADRGVALTRQLLTFSRKQVLAPVALNLNSVITDMEQLLRRLLGQQVELATQLASNLGTVQADPSQIGQVLLNLAINARDAMPGEGTLTISTANVVLGTDADVVGSDLISGPYVLLTVQDSGVGMDAETLAHIFEPFFTTKEPGKGTGLGLATVYGIVQQSNGHIEVKSAPGHGTSFQIYIPQRATTPDPGATPLPKEHSVGGHV